MHRTGPPGSAICLYHSQATPLTAPPGDDNQGLFDIFEEDIVVSPTNSIQHNFYDCTGQIRPTSGPAETVTVDNVLINKALEQIGQNAFFIFDGY